MRRAISTDLETSLSVQDLGKIFRSIAEPMDRVGDKLGGLRTGWRGRMPGMSNRRFRSQRSQDLQVDPRAVATVCAEEVRYVVSLARPHLKSGGSQEGRIEERVRRRSQHHSPLSRCTNDQGEVSRHGQPEVHVHQMQASVLGE